MFEKLFCNMNWNFFLATLFCIQYCIYLESWSKRFSDCQYCCFEDNLSTCPCWLIEVLNVTLFLLNYQYCIYSTPLLDHITGWCNFNPTSCFNQKRSKSLQYKKTRDGGGEKVWWQHPVREEGPGNTNFSKEDNCVYNKTNTVLWI